MTRLQLGGKCCVHLKEVQYYHRSTVATAGRTTRGRKDVRRNGLMHFPKTILSDNSIPFTWQKSRTLFVFQPLAGNC